MCSGNIGNEEKKRKARGSATQELSSKILEDPKVAAGVVVDDLPYDDMVK